MAAKAQPLPAKKRRKPTKSSAGFENSQVAILAHAVDAHRAGDLTTAEDAYRRVLKMSPDYPSALHFMGVIEHQKGNNSVAIDMIGRAVDQLPGHADAYCNLGAAYYADGQLTRAEASFRRSTELKPDFAEAHANLGAVLEDLDRWVEAGKHYEAASENAPENPKYLKMLGDLHLKLKAFETAVGWFERYLDIAVDDGEISNNIGYAYERLDRLDEAVNWYSKAVALCPDSPEINRNMAAILGRSGRADEADKYLKRALEFGPEKWADLADLAGNYVNRSEAGRAMPLYEQLVELRPGDSKLWNDFGVAASALGHMSFAEECFKKAIELNPDFHEAYNNIGSNFLRLGRWNDAVTYFKKAIEISPSYLAPQINICLALSFSDRLDEGYFYAQAVVMHDEYTPIMFSNPHKIFRAVCDFDSIDAFGDSWIELGRSNTVDFSANFLEMMVLADDDQKIGNLVQLHRNWGSSLLQRLPGKKLDPVPAGSRTGKIKIGILSSDLRAHAVAKFALPVLQYYDRDKFEFYAYSPYEKSGDQVQLQVKELIAEFKVTADMSEYEVAQLIREDEIDILFELNGFTRDNGLTVFPYKPAPVQIFWLGYPFTIGIPEIDYILLDRTIRPEDDATLVEKALEMPESWVCFGSFIDEPINPIVPLERNGYVTFGSLNNCYKLTRHTIAQWCKIMHQVPDSRFLYVRPECRSLVLCNNLINEFGSHGIGPERLHLVNNYAVNVSHLTFYDEMDISLDTFPLTGGTTTCDSLWMGVPVISKVGPALHQRLSYGLMSSVGLEELCVKTDEDYIEKAVALAQDLESIKYLRQQLRPMILQSPLCRAEDFTRDFCNLMTEVAHRHGLR